MEMKAKSETRNWAAQGALIGVVVGATLAIAEVVLYNMGAFQLNFAIDQQPGSAMLAQIGIPFILILFGALAGALVGGGTPRYNPHPQQGRGRAYHYLRRRRYAPYIEKQEPRPTV